jgi:PIN domain nuclease of toxin-antitoxin system
MIAAVADTHTAIWYLFDDPRLSRLAGDFIDRAALEGRNIAVSSISLAEVVYLVEKKRLPMAAYDVLRDALSDPIHAFVEMTFSAVAVEAMWNVSRAEIPDMPDRMIAATALSLDVPVITRDGRIRGAGLSTIW